MKTQAVLRDEFHRLLESDRLEEAEAVLKDLEPLSESEWANVLANAPMDDEPVSPELRSRFDTLKRLLADAEERKAG